MTPFDNRYWNLAQAAAWVVFRDQDLVAEFERPTREAWSALFMYPTMHRYRQVEPIDVLRQALIDGNVAAQARRTGTSTEFETVPAIEWVDLIIRPPTAFRTDPKLGRIEPYSAFLFKSADMKKHWRSVDEQLTRSKYDLRRLSPIWAEVRKRLPDANKETMIKEFLDECSAKGLKKIPGRTTVQRYLKTGKLAQN